MNLFDINTEKGTKLVEKVDVKYRPAFASLPLKQRAAAALYFLPHHSAKPSLGVTRPRVIKWYCPFADQKEFPSGHRYCINVYAGCSHQCQYCYADSYQPGQPACKDNYKTKLLKDLCDLNTFDVPPAPVHLSNSTDPLQSLEQKHGLTLYTLEQILRFRRHFSSVVILTKNPAILLNSPYMAILKQLCILPNDHPHKAMFEQNAIPPLRVEISVAFADQADADFYDPAAPPLAERTAAIRQLRRCGIPVILRIDPLVPRNAMFPYGKLEDFGLPDAQSLDKLETLVQFACRHHLLHVVYSVAKIVSVRHKPMPPAMVSLKKVYERLNAPEKLIFKGGSWRLSSAVAKQYIIDPFINLCRHHHVSAYFCKQNLLLTP